MVKLSSITTRTGDRGETSLGDGQRREKHDERVVAYGAIDETNSAIGLARALLEQEGGDSHIVELLSRVQNELFDVGADLCVPEKGLEKGLEKGRGQKALRISAAYIERLEASGSRLNEGLPVLDSFILPAGTAGVSALHVARATCRRAERAITRLQESEAINPECLKYMNRLSDFLFIMARYLSRGREVKWRPQKW